MPVPTKLKRYVEWMSRGRLTGRVAFALDPRKVPEPKPGAEWQVDQNFNAAEALLERPELRFVIKAALDNGVAMLEDPPAERGPA